ncbi:MAG: heavy metal translocating P-type ATPase, partial [Armatimonadota bacterium]
MEKRFQIVLTTLCGVLGVVGWLSGNLWVSYAAVAAGSPFALRSTYLSLKEREIDVNFLMMLAALGSVALGKPNEAAALLFLFSLSNTLEAFAMGRTQSAIAG